MIILLSLFTFLMTFSLLFQYTMEYNYIIISFIFLYGSCRSIYSASCKNLPSNKKNHIDDNILKNLFKRLHFTTELCNFRFFEM
jgi:hypothetical protein